MTNLKHRYHCYHGYGPFLCAVTCSTPWQLIQQKVWKQSHILAYSCRFVLAAIEAYLLQATAAGETPSLCKFFDQERDYVLDITKPDEDFRNNWKSRFNRVVKKTGVVVVCKLHPWIILSSHIKTLCRRIMSLIGKNWRWHWGKLVVHQIMTWQNWRASPLRAKNPAHQALQQQAYPPQIFAGLKIHIASWTITSAGGYITMTERRGNQWRMKCWSVR